VETNIVIFAVADAPGLVERLAGRVELQAFDGRRVRAVTHLDVERGDIDLALAAIAEALALTNVDRGSPRRRSGGSGRG
jgi:threonine aldolase